MTNNELAALANHCRTLLHNSGVKAESDKGSAIVHAFFTGAMCMDYQRTGNMSPNVVISLMCGRHLDLLDVKPTEEPT